jgi:hypothetical protein
MPARKPPSKLAVARLQRGLTIKQLCEKDADLTAAVIVGYGLA